MRCPHCDAENRLGARFCGACGELLPAMANPPTVTCVACGADVRPGARFCPRCGADIKPVPGPPSAMPDAVQVIEPSVGDATVRPSPPTVITPVDSVSHRRAAWLPALVMALLSSCCLLCAVIGLAAVPALNRELPPLPVVDAAQPDITLLVEETYIGERVSSALPAAIGGSPHLDVRPDNRVVVNLNFSLLIVRLEVGVHSLLAVEDGQLRVHVERIETGGHNLLELIGIDQLSLGDEITGTIQRVLERELGAGSRLLAIRTDEQRVVLTARWE